MDPERPMAGAGDGVMLSALPPDALAAFVEVAGAGFPLVSVELRHLEGELGRDRPENGALSSIGAQYALYAVGVAADPQLELAAQRQVEAIKTAMVPWTAEHMYMNFAETSRDPASFWTEQAYHRLRRIKAAVDPDDLIRSNHPLAATPATAAAA
jgi:hypothetical protein